MKERSELHCHTKMSEMSGLADVRKLILKAKKMGMPAIAITDNDTVQAFPEAFREWRRAMRESGDREDSIKVLFGIEASMVDDLDAVIVNDKGQSFETDFVVIDTETTGLSPVFDKIIEIGAVRVSSGKIVDTFSSLINPGIHIPATISELTGISDEMVANSDCIEIVLPKFMEFCQGAVLVAHNAPFDIEFIRENIKRIGMSEDFTVVDSLNLSRMLLKDNKRHTLRDVAKALNIPIVNLHRALDDADLTTRVFLRFLDMMKEQGITTLQETKEYSVRNYVMTKGMIDHKIIIIPKTIEGMYDLYNLIAGVNFFSFDNYLKIPKSMLIEKRKGLFIGSCAQKGEVSTAVLDNQRDESIRNIMRFYDFIEVEPTDNYIYAISNSITKRNLTTDQVKEGIKRIVEIGKDENVPVVASANVHYMNKEDIDAFKVLRHASRLKDPKGWKAKHHLMSTKELMEEFRFLGEETATEIVVNNTDKVAAELRVVQPISYEKQYPVYPDADLKLRSICYKKAHELYGDSLPTEVKKRIEYELIGIRKNDFATLYMIAYELVKKSSEAGYLVSNRGSSGASLVSFFAGITESNPLHSHYLCKNCKYTDFEVNNIKGYHYGDLGMDLPDKECPVCGKMLSKEGFDLPVETFLGLNLDKEPDFDIGFAYEYKREAQLSVLHIEGTNSIFRPGTIDTINERQAKKYVCKYFKDEKRKKGKESIKEVTEKLVGVKCGEGVLPEGIITMRKGVEIEEYTPITYCEQDDIPLIPKTMIDYFVLDGKILKLDIMGEKIFSFLKYLEDKTGVNPRDICLYDEKILSLFSSLEALRITSDEIGGVTVGTLGIPEFGNTDVRNLLELIRPNRYSDIIKVIGMMHGSQVWKGNAEKVVMSDLSRLRDCISSRDDIMIYLLGKGIDREKAFRIMENVRKGKGRYNLKEEWIADMRNVGVPEWYIKTCKRILYLFPKAYGTQIFLTSWRLLYYKLYYPEAFYGGWMKYQTHEIDDVFIEKGYEHAKEKCLEMMKKEKNKMGWRQKKMLDELLVVMEMHSRGIHME